MIATNFVVGIYSMGIWACCDGFQQMSLGMLPIVRYIGYAILSQNCVSWVLSEEIIRGTTVAPGSRSSRKDYIINQYHLYQNKTNVPKLSTTSHKYRAHCRPGRCAQDLCSVILVQMPGYA